MSDTDINAVIDDINKTHINADKDAAAARAREHNWAPRVAYDYSVYGARKDSHVEGLISGDEPAWAANAAKYEWLDEYGDVGPAVPELEAQLFRNDQIMKSGLKIDTFKEYRVTVEGPIKIRPVVSFDDAGLHPVMLENIKLCGYTVPTPVQAYTIPAVLQGRDVVACAQTGSGKTAAYLAPILSRLMGKAKKLAARRPNPVTYDPATDKVRAEPLVLIVVPTRELAIQIFGEARRLCYRSMLRPCIVYGGAPSRTQREELEKGCDVLIATPGRLIDFMNRPTLLSLNRVK